MLTIRKVDSNFEREPFSSLFGFKGGFVSEAWQTVAKLTDDRGRSGVGVGNQGVLWSDPRVFMRESQASGNALMFQITSYALRCCEGREFADPGAMFDEIFLPVLEFGRSISGLPRLRPTFVLNALVAVDNAAWQLHAGVNGWTSFDELLTPEIRPALQHRHRLLCNIPLVTYALPVAEARRLAEAGHFVLKIKIGSDPDRDGDQEKMLAWDCDRMSRLHEALRDCATPHTTDGRIAYYLDANGRYDSLDRVRRLLDHCKRIGALSQIILLEEPLPEEYEGSVQDLPVRVAADESAHSVEDVGARIAAGYGAIALKPVAKTLTMSLRMAAAAHAAGVPCFCADLTAGPVLIDWGKNVAARLAPLPGLGIGILESNGSQYYRNWERMKSHHPDPTAGWLEPRDGLYQLDDRFYATAGGIFQPSPYYASLVAASKGGGPDVENSRKPYAGTLKADGGFPGESR